MRKPALTKREDGLALGSDYFTVLDIMYDELVGTVREHDGLSLTQYRILLCLFTAAEEDKTLGNTDLSNYLDIKPNALTQALDSLDSDGFITRSHSKSDARARIIALTDKGHDIVKTVDKALADSIFPVFEDNLPFRAYTITQEAVILVGMNAEHASQPPYKGYSSVGVVSPYISALYTVETKTQEALKAATGASYNECRIMFLIAETDRPLRAKDICARLLLTPSTVTRATKKLMDRGWIESTMDKSGLQYSSFIASDEGKKVQTIIIDVVDDIADKNIWNQLDKTHRFFVNIAGEAVLDSKGFPASECFTPAIKEKLLQDADNL